MIAKNNWKPTHIAADDAEDDEGGEVDEGVGKGEKKMTKKEKRDAEKEASKPKTVEDEAAKALLDGTQHDLFIHEMTRFRTYPVFSSTFIEHHLLSYRP